MILKSPKISSKQTLRKLQNSIKNSFKTASEQPLNSLKTVPKPPKNSLKTAPKNSLPEAESTSLKQQRKML